MATGSSPSGIGAARVVKAAAAAVGIGGVAATAAHAAISTAPAAVDAITATRTRPVEKMYAGAPVPAYNGPRFGFCRPAELERGGSRLPALPAGLLANQSGAGSGPGRCPHRDRGGSAWAERGPAGRALRRGGGQTARSVAFWYRPLSRRRFHHQHPEMPAAGKPGSAAGRSGGVLTVSRATTPAHQAGGRPRARSARPGAPVTRV